MAYSNHYARRYLRSPYASQFADLFVTLAVDHFETLAEKDILEVLSFMDVPRQREVYLRMARLAAISGKNRLATLAADRAQVLAGKGESMPKVLADLYGGLASVPSDGVVSAMETIMSIPDDQLSAKDRALKAAATAVAAEVLRTPIADVLPLQPTDDPALAGLAVSASDTAEIDDASMDPRAGASPVAEIARTETQTQTGQERKDTATSDPAFDTFVSYGRSRLDEVDALLKGEGS